MFPSSSQKQHWTFGTRQDIEELGESANMRYIERFASVLMERPDIERDDLFLTPKEEKQFCRIVAEAGIRFSDDFKPDMWPSVRWTAFAYFKRFYLRESIMEYSPKNVMIACYYLAAKVDEFNISIDNFVDNLSNGTRESNIEMVLTLEPVIMLKLDYHLTIHAPFRPFEGHLIGMKARMANEIAAINLDLESVRPHSTEFFKKCLYGDALLLYAPSQIALAAIKYGLDKTIGASKEATFIRDYLIKLFDPDFGGTGERNMAELFKMEKLQIRIDQIVASVLEASQGVSPEESAQLQKRYITCVQKINLLLPRLRQLEKEQQQQTGSSVTGAFDSDDDF